jgi:DNA-binding response OmpR family regulator
MNPMTTDSCSFLIVEDDPKTAGLLVEFVRSLGMSGRVATSLEEVDVAIAEGDFCGVPLRRQPRVGSLR